MKKIHPGVLIKQKFTISLLDYKTKDKLLVTPQDDCIFFYIGVEQTTKGNIVEIHAKLLHVVTGDIYLWSCHVDFLGKQSEYEDYVSSNMLLFFELYS